MRISTVAALPLALFLTQDAAVPVARESHHHRVLENEWVRVYDVVVAPGDSTLYHVHASDYLFVTIGAADLMAQPIGGAATPLRAADGEVRFTKATITHRVVNPAASPRFHNLTIEVLKTPSEARGVAPGGPAPAPTAHGSSLVLENDRVRAVRLVLDPGDSVPMHTHQRPGLAVIVHGGMLGITTPGHAVQYSTSNDGDYIWNGGSRTHSLVNVGKTRFEVVEIEWK
ncbi:MAG: hypothetical protein M3081_19490 [Gemmatimonadota bacterium]|nr:hypothetical protein [Gemmatimonadota bacterium]